MILDYIFLPAVLLLGSVTSYEDCKYSKIKNKWILKGLVWALGVYSILALWLLLSDHLTLFYKAKNFMSFIYIYDSLINAFIALAIGYLIWYFDLWSAGDAKLFFVFSLLLPLTYYSRSYLPFFPSFALLINVFVPAMIFLFFQKIYIIFKDMLGRMVRLRDPKNLWISVKTYYSKNRNILLKSSISFFLIFLTFQLFRQMVQNQLKLNQIFSSIIFLSFFGASGFLQKALKNNYVLLLLIYLLALYLAISGFAAIVIIGHTIINSLVFLVAFPVVLFVFSYCERNTNQQKMPFALWLFLGVVITIILKGSAVSFLLSLGNH